MRCDARSGKPWRAFCFGPWMALVKAASKNMLGHVGFAGGHGLSRAVTGWRTVAPSGAMPAFRNAAVIPSVATRLSLRAEV